MWCVTSSVALAQGDMSALRGRPAAPPTTAPPTTSTPLATDAATDWRAHYDDAIVAFHAGDVARALVGFTRAYELGGPAILSFDMAVCFDRLSRRQDAVQSYQRYLVLVPDATNRAEVEARIEVLSSSPRLASHLGTSEAPSVMTLLAEPPTTAPIVYGAGPELDTPPSASTDIGPEWTVSWVFLGITAASAAGAGIAYGIGSNQFDELDAYCRSVAGCTDEEISSDPSNTSATAATVLWVTTGVLGGITIASFVIEGLVTANPPRRTSISRAGLSLDLSIGPGSLAIRGAF
jgi:hypothetical protein